MIVKRSQEELAAAYLGCLSSGADTPIKLKIENSVVNFKSGIVKLNTPKTGKVHLGIKNRSPSFPIHVSVNIVATLHSVEMKTREVVYPVEKTRKELT